MRVILSIFAVLVLPLLSVAQQSDETRPETNAQALITEAVAEYTAGRFAEAYALFNRAHEIQPSARTLRGLGMAAFETRSYGEALRALRSALSTEERALSPEQRDHVEDLIARAERYVGQYSLHITPESAIVTVDGQPVAPSDGVLHLGLGTHELRVTCADCREWSRRIVVRGGEQEQIEVDASPSVEEILDTPDPSPAVEPPASDPPSNPPRSRRVGPIVFASLGAVIVVSGLGVGGAALGKQAELEDGCPTRRDCSPDLANTRREAMTFARVSDALWITGAAAIATAGIWWLLTRNDDSPSASIGCGVAGCRAELRVPLR